jgi:RNA polymerase sigma-70 factor (ECF subfamily)
MSRFPTTQWSLIVRVEDRTSDDARQALERLCATYWPPLYAYVRMRGHATTEAEDLVQGFFARFLAKDDPFTTVDRRRGRLRSYLLGALNHYLADERDRARAAKRGGGDSDIPIDLDFGRIERDWGLRETRESDPEQAYDRKWALALLDRVLRRLREEYEEVGQAERFDVLVPFVDGGREPRSHREVGDRLGIREGTARVAVHRLRKRYRELVREEIASTLVDESDVDDELRCLMRALSG